MANTILIKRSGTAAAIPGSGNLSLGELAINYADGTLFYKDGGGTVKVIASNQTFTLSGNIAAGNISTGGLITATGNVQGGNLTTVGQVSATGNVTGNYFIGNGRFLSGIDTTLISNGNSSVQTLANANITVNPGGTANVVVFDPAGGTVTGYWSVSGNVTSGNVNTGIVSASGNITGANLITAGNVYAPAIVNNGTYNTDIQLGAASGIIAITTNGNSTQFGPSGTITLGGASQVIGGTFGGSGLTVAGTQTDIFQNRGGNVTVQVGTGGTIANTWTFAQDGSFTSPGAVSATGNATAGNITTAGIANVGTLAVTGTSGFTGNVTGSNISLSGNIAANGVLTDNYYYANGAPVDFQQAAGSNTQLQFNNNNDFGASANLTFNSATNQFTLIGTANVTNLNVSSNASVTGNVNSGNVNTVIVSASGNVTGANLVTVGAADVGTLAVTSGATVGTTLSVTGNATLGNVITGGLVSSTGNVTGGNLTTVGIANIGTLAVTNSTTIGTTLSVTGNATLGNVITSGLISATGNVNGGNVNTAIVSASGNIIGGNLSVGAGTISSTGNVNVGNVNTAILSASGNITGANIDAGSGIITTTGNLVAGNVTTVGIANIGTMEVTGNGTVSGYLSVTGNVTGGNLITNGALSTSGNIGANNINITNTATATTLSATGSLIAANASVSGTLTVTGNIQSNSTVIANTFSSVGAGMTLQPASGNINLFTTSTGNVVLQNNYINNLAAPVQATDAVTKQYVDDAVSSGITIHPPVYVESPVALSATYAQGGTTHTVNTITNTKTLTFSANHGLSVNDQIYWSSAFNGILANTAYFVYSTPALNEVTLSTSYGGVELTGLTNGTGLTATGRANSGQGATLTNSGANAALTVDGVTVSSTQRVLVYNQTNAYENGVYVVTDAGAPDSPGPGSAWVLTRSSDMDTYIPNDIMGVDAGDYFYVQAGDTGAGESYVLTSPTGSIILGYNNLTFTQFSASQVYTANTSAGLTLNGTVFSAKVDNNTTAFSGGNIVVKASANLTTPNIGAATGNSLSLTGNLIAANIGAGTGVITTSGNITGGNLLFGTGVVSGTGNIFATNIDATGIANVANLVVYSFANVTAATAANDTTSGALRVAGGVGVVGNVYAGGMYVGTDSVLTINSTVDGGTY
jgi:filamentous hemagglutinin